MPTRVVNSTMIGGMMFGRMWRHRMRLRRSADRLRGMHVHVLPHRHYGGADNARAGNAQQQPERADDLRNARTEHGDHDQQDDQIRKAHPGIDEALRDQIDLAAEITGQDSDHDRDNRCERRGGKSDDHRQLRAIEAPRQHVAAEIVGSERISPGRRQQTIARADLNSCRTAPARPRIFRTEEKARRSRRRRRRAVFRGTGGPENGRRYCARCRTRATGMSVTSAISGISPWDRAGRSSDRPRD